MLYIEKLYETVTDYFLRHVLKPFVKLPTRLLFGNYEDKDKVRERSVSYGTLDSKISKDSKEKVLNNNSIKYQT